jgi:hypothetical protein
MHPGERIQLLETLLRAALEVITADSELYQLYQEVEEYHSDIHKYLECCCDADKTALICQKAFNLETEIKRVLGDQQ